MLEHGLERIPIALAERGERHDLDPAVPQATDPSAMPIAMAVRCAVICSACGTARASVNAVDDIRSRTMVFSM
ncbi:hypothetical protein GCM10025863_03470 [Microbacterium suwonense]|uniref:Uncharacterized protein n=1 Tax=Microbacterium suwonense TaxID=683047 RepID=A0ABM8FQL1_9MICO|nr:hypothetical protein GCM10025863_03470 [Microbacterium suwonense]